MPASIRHLGPGIEVESGTFENEFRWMHNRFWEGREITGFVSGTSRDAGNPQIPQLVTTPSNISQAVSAVLTLPTGHGFANGDVVLFDGVDNMVEINGDSGTLSSVGATSAVVDIDTSGYTAFDDPSPPSPNHARMYKQGRTQFLRMGLLMAYDTAIKLWVPYDSTGSDNRDRVRGVLVQSADMQPDGVNRDQELLIVTNAPLRPSRLIEAGFAQVGIIGHTNEAVIRADLRDEMLCPLDDQFENL